MNIAPSTEIIRALRNQGLTWKDALGEVIDNAFDASAQAVHVLYDGQDLVVSDDGNGCADLASMLTLGKHQHQPGTRLGRYGVGLKDAALWLGGHTHIASIKGMRRSVEVRWNEIEKSGVWEIPDPTEIAATSGERGTKVTFRKIEREPPAGKDWSRLVEEIGYIFTPAIRGGRQIIFKPKTRSAQLVAAPRFELPPLEEIVDVKFQVAGKDVHLHVGVVPEGAPNPKAGISYTHGFRVIIPASGLGCGYQHGYSRVAGWAHLGDGWDLKKNKDGITLHRDELAEAVYDHCRAVVTKGSGQAMSITSSALAASLTAWAKDAFREVRTDVKERRGKGDSHGTVTPKNTGRQRRRATRVQPGTRVLQTIASNRLRVVFMPLGGMVGKVDGPASVVCLGSDHPTVARAMRDSNHDALRVLVGCFLSNHASSTDPSGQLLLRCIADVASDEKFSVGLGALLSTMEFPEGPRLTVVSAAGGGA